MPSIECAAIHVTTALDARSTGRGEPATGLKGTFVEEVSRRSSASPGAIEFPMTQAWLGHWCTRLHRLYQVSHGELDVAVTVAVRRAENLAP